MSNDVPSAVGRTGLLARALTPIEVDETQLLQEVVGEFLEVSVRHFVERQPMLGWFYQAEPQKVILETTGNVLILRRSEICSGKNGRCKTGAETEAGYAAVVGTAVCREALRKQRGCILFSVEDKCEAYPRVNGSAQCRTVSPSRH